MKVFIRCLIVQFLILTAKGQRQPNSSKISCRPVADVVFLLDGSDSISDDEFSQQKLLLQKFVEQADLGADTVRLGGIVVSSAVGDTLSLASRGNKTLLYSEIESLQQPMEGSRTDLGLIAMEQMFGFGGRPGVVRIGVVMTDGRAKFERATLGEADVVKNAGVFLVAVGVGRLIQFHNLETMASTRGNAYPILPVVISAKMLTETVKFLGQEACNGQALLNELSKTSQTNQMPQNAVPANPPNTQQNPETLAQQPSRQNPVISTQLETAPNIGGPVPTQGNIPQQDMSPQRALFEPMSVLSSLDVSALGQLKQMSKLSPLDLRSANFTLISREIAKDAARLERAQQEPTIAQTQPIADPTTTKTVPTTKTTTVPLNANLASNVPRQTPPHSQAPPAQQLGDNSAHELYKIFNMNSFKFEGKAPASLIGLMPKSTFSKIQAEPKPSVHKETVVDLSKQSIASLPKTPVINMPKQPAVNLPKPAVVHSPAFKSPFKLPTKTFLNFPQKSMIDLIKQPSSNLFKDSLMKLSNQNTNGIKIPVNKPTTQAPPGGPTLSPYIHGIHRELAAHQCSQAHNIDGVGYSFHPKSCTEFMQCFQKHGTLNVEIGKCPFETFFDEELVVCRYHRQSNCYRDPCKDTDVISYKHSDNCRAYWGCGTGKSTPKCCPYGSAYTPGYGCIRNTTCKDMCMDFGNLKQVIAASKCKLLGMESNPKYYFESVAGVGWVIRTCPYGSRFDQSSCNCRLVAEAKAMTSNCNPELYLDFKDFQDKSGNGLSLGNTNVDIESGTGVFDGNSLLKLWRFSGLNVRAPKGKLMHLVSNCCYGCTRVPTPSLDIAVIPGHNGGIGVFSASTGAAGEVFVYVPYEDTITGWNQLSYSYNGRVLTGTINGARNSKQIIGDIESRSDPLMIGACSKNGAFQGYMDELKFYLCDV